MCRRRLVRAALAGAALVLAGSAPAATRTYVSLAGPDPAAHPLGMPGIAVTVRGLAGAAADTLRSELVRDLGTLVYTRALRDGESGDYALTVAMERRLEDGATVTLPFEAALTAADGATLWRVTGRTEVAGAPVDASTYASLARNVLSALIHDGWVAPRYDPADPPPAAPVLRRD